MHILTHTHTRTKMFFPFTLHEIFGLFSIALTASGWIIVSAVGHNRLVSSV